MSTIINPPLSDKNQGGGFGFGGGDHRPAQPAPPRPRPDFSGLFPRAAAFVVDSVVLYFAAFGLDKVAHETLVALNPALPWLAYPAAFLYFWLMQGPLGRGQTIGKKLLDIRVVNAAGNPPGWGAAALRSLMQTAVYAISIQINPMFMVMGLPIATWKTASATIGVLSGLTLIWGVSLLTGIVIHPRRRGWHDLAGKTWVTNLTPDETFEEKTSAPFSPRETRALKQYRLGMPAIALIGALMVTVPTLMNLSDAEVNEQFNDMVARQTLAPAGYASLYTSDPTDFWRQVNEKLREQEAKNDDPSGDRVTSETLRKRFGVWGETNLASIMKISGSMDPDLQDAAWRAGIDALRAELWRRSEQNRIEAMANGETPPAATQFQLYHVEPVTLLLYRKNRVNYGVHGAANPADGPLVFELDETAPKLTTDDTPTTAPQES